MSPGKRKRVTFAEEPPVVHIIPAAEATEDSGNDSDDNQPRRPYKSSATLSGRKPADCKLSRRKLSDIQEALMAQRQGEDTMQELEDGSVMNDVAAAEEDYDRPAQAYNEAGVAFEPFHLKNERQEGFFDAEGNYIQYKLEEVKDAWLDSLKPGESSASTATDCTKRRPKRHKSSSQAELQDLDADELHAYKRRLVDMLQPYETVLTALRRLGGKAQPGQTSSGLSWKRAKKGKMKSQEQLVDSSSSHAKSPTSARSGSTVPVEHRAQFDRLTEYSSLLLQHGENNIYSTPREQLAAQLEISEAAELQAVMGILSTAEQPIAANQAATDGPVTAQQAPVDPDEDMFAASEPQPAPASAVQDGSTANQPPVTQNSEAQAATHGQTFSTDSNFTFDENTGTWFNADMGYYYDASQGLYGDAASGHWYSYRDGAYQLVY